MSRSVTGELPISVEEALEKLHEAAAKFSVEFKGDKTKGYAQHIYSILDKRLSKQEYFSDTYSIADISIWSWYGALVLGRLYDAEEFLDVKTYKNVLRWAKEINDRQAVKRGIMVNKIKGNPSSQLHERHSSSDFIHKTQDKLKKS